MQGHRITQSRACLSSNESSRFILQLTWWLAVPHYASMLLNFVRFDILWRRFIIVHLWYLDIWFIWILIIWLNVYFTSVLDRNQSCDNQFWFQCQNLRGPCIFAKIRNYYNSKSIISFCPLHIRKMISATSLLANPRERDAAAGEVRHTRGIPYFSVLEHAQTQRGQPIT